MPSCPSNARPSLARNHAAGELENGATKYARGGSSPPERFVRFTESKVREYVQYIVIAAVEEDLGEESL
jgi:hypothetical protein